MRDSREPRRDSDAVADILVTEAMCVECLVTKTGLDVDRVLGAITRVAADLQLVRIWSRCPACSRKDRAILTVDVF